MTTVPDDDWQRGCAACLAGLPGMGPRALADVLHHADPGQAWAALVRGEAPRGLRTGSRPMPPEWIDLASRLDPGAVIEAHRRAGVTVLLRPDGHYPALLAADLDPPAVLFARGALPALDRRRVAIVGTRRCTGVGAGFARELGGQLADAGVAVVSGLALGIDGAAHRGVLEAGDDAAPPVGIVGSGLDVVYPSRHRDLWQSVTERGLLLSELPLGQRPTAWRFPARNRLLAALAEVVVVVESHRAGGSMHTVTEAIRRGVEVLAVPGSVRNPAAGGTNQLLAEGCHPVLDAGDVLVALGLSTATASVSRPEERPAPDANGRTVLDAFGWEPATLDHLAIRSGLPLPSLTAAIEDLLAAGWVTLSGGWYEREAAR